MRGKLDRTDIDLYMCNFYKVAVMAIVTCVVMLISMFTCITDMYDYIYIYVYIYMYMCI